MKRFLCAFILGIAAACFSSAVYADTVTVTVGFEHLFADIGENSAWGGRVNGIDYIKPFPDSPEFEKVGDAPGPYGTVLSGTRYTVNGVTFSHAGSSDAGGGMGFWFGTGLSTQTNTEDRWFTNEMASANGSGNKGSSVYGVVYGDSTVGLPYNDPMLPVMMFMPGVELVSIALSSTAYATDSMTYGDQFAQAGGWMNLLIYGIDANGELVGTVTQSYDEMLHDWITVDLSGLIGAESLSFAWESDDVLDMGPGMTWLNYPVYFAFDDIVYRYDDGNSSVPEPATLAILGLGLTGLALVRKRRNK